MSGSPELTWGVPLAVLTAATVFDLRSRRVPAWLTGGGIAAGVLLAAWNGPSALVASLGGAAGGGLVFLPFVWRGWLGGAEHPRRDAAPASPSSTHRGRRGSRIETPTPHPCDHSRGGGSTPANCRSAG